MPKKLNKTESSILKGLKEAIEYSKGNLKAKKHSVKVPVVNVREARTKLGLTQEEFASTFGVSTATVKNWEQGRRTPNGAAKVLLNVIQIEPEAVKRALGESHY
jgi:putative transcriptional regulator